MCGIYFSVSKKEYIVPSEGTLKMLSNRGPDHSALLQVNLSGSYITLFSSVLHLRGETMCKQPLKTKRFILQWNGEMFDDSLQNWENESDTKLVMELFENISLDIPKVIAGIRGPFAFVLVDMQEAAVYFGRDIFGRRSLLQTQYGESLILQSLGGNGQEIQANCIFKYCLTENKLISFPYDSLGVSIPEITLSLMQENDLEALSLQFKEFLSKSIKKRLVNIHGSITILFSGGVDSLLLAALTASISHAELVLYCLNVAFSANDDFETVPDRITGRNAFQELICLYPNRQFHFIPVNIGKDQFDAKRDHVKQLMYPNDSVMDESIAMALWFSSLHSPSRVLFLGMGADEQLGGYSRHLNNFKVSGYELLRDELQLDLGRISARNMGRDDRVISDNAKEARFPFLDEEFVYFTSKMVPIDCKINSYGNKFILRRVLQLLGFSEVICSTIKRAIQFGARTARLQQS